MATFDMSKFHGVIKWRIAHKPVGWIARELGITLRDVNTILRLAGSPVKGSEISAERYDELQAFVEQGVSISEIMRTTGCDSRTIARWFPGYAPFPVGGGGEASIIRQVNQELRRIDKHGNLSTRRGK
jgi:hypothetical protein